MSEYNSFAADEADISDICAATIFKDGIPNTPEAKEYIANQTLITPEGMKVECARCASCVLYKAGVEEPQNGDCLYY
jgi:hypothetical protein